MFSKNLAETILFSPISSGADSINILSGIATPTMASWYLTSLHEKVRVSFCSAPSQSYRWHDFRRWSQFLLAFGISGFATL